MRCDSLQFFSYVIAYIESRNKIFDGCFIYLQITSRQLFQFLIWIGIVFSAQNCLNSLGNYGPIIIEIVGYAQFAIVIYLVNSTLVIGNTLII